jgi:tellurite methyltransferase
MKSKNHHDRKYEDEEYYLGIKPSVMCDQVMEIIQPSHDYHPRLLDLGCGEGRNAVYFAKHGFEVFALDASFPRLQRTKRYAEEVEVYLETIQADIINYQLENTYDIIFSTGILHHLPPAVRRQHFQNYKDCTSPDGINALSVFVRKPFIPREPDAEPDVYPYTSGELMFYYWDWEILHCTEDIFEYTSGGVTHKHAIDRIIARRYPDTS